MGVVNAANEVLLLEGGTLELDAKLDCGGEEDQSLQDENRVDTDCTESFH
jgi:hypothetical protein